MIRRAALTLAAMLPLPELTGPARAAPLVLPDDALRTLQRDGGAVAAGPAGPAGVPLVPRTGTVAAEAWRLPGTASTEAVMAGLAAQLASAGWTTLFTCETRACGGFDFRYGLPVIPEPDMHVSLGDFRYLAAQDGDRAVGVLVSRSGDAAHVEITRIGPSGLAGMPPATAPSRPADTPVATEQQATPDAFVARLLADGHVALDDLEFATGAAALAEGELRSLALLAAFLEANPERRLTLVGHTDSAGALAANIALSRRRAETVAEVLVTRFGADRRRIAAEGAGWLAPRATNATPEGRQLNRRVEAVLN
jgi:OOP family OmpA-OmpF porin